MTETAYVNWFFYARTPKADEIEAVELAEQPRREAEQRDASIKAALKVAEDGLLSEDEARRAIDEVLP